MRELRVSFSRRLSEALKALGLDGEAPVVELIKAYEGAERFYHNLLHVEECHRAAEPLGPVDPKVTVALCYHDAVYDSRAKDNEERSADWARRDLEALGAEPALCDDVVRLILATAHRNPPQADDERLIVDADLSILGQPAALYDRYAAAVRQEYAWVSDADYRRGRGQFLRGLLARQNLFSTKEMRERHEAGARTNLERELCRWEE